MVIAIKNKKIFIIINFIKKHNMINIYNDGKKKTLVFLKLGSLFN